MGLNADQMQRDLNVLWHPCTQMRDCEHSSVIPIRRGEDVRSEDFKGKRYVDTVSSWWVNVFGHVNPRTNQRIKDQVDQLEHMILAGLSHQSVIELSKRLVKITPLGLDRVFYADGGSAGIEVALKTSYHFQLGSGRPHEKRFVTPTNSYHGETIAAMLVSDMAPLTEIYRSLLLDTTKVLSLDCFLCPDGMHWEEHSRNIFAHMERTLAEGHDKIAVVIVEPLTQGAGGMRMYYPVYLKLPCEARDRYGVHLIHNKITAGFGHTGTMFACEQAGIVPDFLCPPRTLTDGYLPVFAMLISGTIYRGFYDDYQTLRTLLHSHTYIGDPLACVAVLTVLDIFKEDKVIETNYALSTYMARATIHLAGHPRVVGVCQAGTVLTIEMVQDKASRTPYPWQERRGLKVFQHDLGRGVLLRPPGSMVYFLSPYVITPEQTDFLTEVASEGIDITTRDTVNMAVNDFCPDHRDSG